MMLMPTPDWRCGHMVTEAGRVAFAASQRAYCVSSQTCFVKEKFTAFSQRLVVFIFWQVTETRTGPLGCSNYDNLDTVSSVLVHSPENKVQLQGKTRSDLDFILLHVRLVSQNVYFSFRLIQHTHPPPRTHPHPSPRAAGRPPELLAEPLHTGGSKLHRLQVRRPVCLPERGLLVRVQCGLSAV